MRSRSLLTLAVAAAAPLIGCGGGEDSGPSAAAVAKAFAEARNQRDTARTCSLYARNIQEQLSREYGGCEAFYRQYPGGSPGGPVGVPAGTPFFATGVHVTGDRASGQLVAKKGSSTSISRITLVREDGQWHVTSFQF
jgi:hypothetical protein